MKLLGEARFVTAKYAVADIKKAPALNNLNRANCQTMQRPGIVVISMLVCYGEEDVHLALAQKNTAPYFKVNNINILSLNVGLTHFLCCFF